MRFAAPIIDACERDALAKTFGERWNVIGINED
jgi:hypothetical protein